MTSPGGFLLARIAEDEALARAASALGYYGSPTALFAYGPVDGVDINAARVLAECEAKRRVVGLWNLRMSEPWEGHPAAPLGGEAAEVYYDALCALAAPFSDHPDFDPVWLAR